MQYRGLFPNDPDPPRWEKLRVLKRVPEYTTLLVVRTESDPEPKALASVDRKAPCVMGRRL